MLEVPASEPADRTWGTRAAALQAADERAQPGHNGAKTPSNSGVGLDRQSSALPRLLTLRQAASYLAVSAGTVRGWVASGTLPAVRLPGGGKLLWIERAALDRLIEASREA